jgi:hypothetical protein
MKSKGQIKKKGRQIVGRYSLFPLSRYHDIVVDTDEPPLEPQQCLKMRRLFKQN